MGACQPNEEQPSRAGKPGPAHGQDVQPGTAQKGKSWQSGRSAPHDKEAQLDNALKDSFPASDPPGPAQPGVTGWDLDDEASQKAGGKR